MRIFKNHPLLILANGYLIDAPQPSNVIQLINFGSFMTFFLAIQIVTGVTLAMHYNPSVAEAFNSVEHIMRDVNNGWLVRYLHSNTASAFFFLVYSYIGRILYYGSYKVPTTIVWIIGTIILVLMMATAFLGYVLPYGHMSLWGATVITNLMSAIPWVGQDIVEFLWGGFSVNNATLNRFFALLFVFFFILAALALMHLIALHDSAGSGNPLGISGNYDRLPLSNTLLKDLILIFNQLLLLIFSLLIVYLLLKIFLSLLPIVYCMDDVTHAKFNLETMIQKVQSSYDYWKLQAELADSQFKQSLISESSEIQREVLEHKKGCEANYNRDSNLLRNLKDKLASGNYLFNNSAVLGKRPLSD